MKKILLPLAMMIVGFILNGIVWSVNIGSPINTICLCFGLGLCFFGFILFIVRLRD
ncbi:hypothetical protein ACEN2I_14620 [Flavobacterium sp. W22_SRS_FK3]|uniref:hypothetical protein n=1 Tax=Flavobacterium sp. W22_SRS_FK3 TaxID=3240275 RepID=UPI003F93884D